jgi:4-amino-4-deoxy-L-arabinose transferase-like glycosyltransferase
MVFFSVAGFYHQYYLIMLAPPIAALTGAGWVELWNQYRCRKGWKMWLLPSALLATTVFEIYILQPYWKQIGWEWQVGIGVVGLVTTLALVLVILLERTRLASVRLAAGVAMAGMLVLMAAPLYWSTTPLLYGVNSIMPQAGPNESGGFGQGPGGAPAMVGPATGGYGGMNSGAGDQLLEYVTKNNTGETCLFATTDSRTAAPYIIAGKPVIALGGFSGGDDTLTKLEQMVKDKKIKFFLIPSGSGFGGGDGADDIVSWIRAHGTEIPVKDWQSGASQGDTRGMGNAETLYEDQRVKLSYLERCVRTEG